MLLKIIWWGSLALAVLSIIIMMVLVLRRLRIQKRAIWWKQKKNDLLPAVFSYLDGEPFEITLGRSIDPSDIRPLQEISLDLISSIRGESKAKLIDFLVVIGGVAVNEKRLRSTKEWERLQAVRDLSIYPKENVAEILRRELHDPSQNLRIAAIRVLIDIGADVTLQDIVDSLFSDGGEKSIALRDIFRRIAPTQTEPFKNLLDQEISEPLTLLTIDALGSTHDYSSIPVLVKQYDSSSIDIRAEVIRALTVLGHPDAEPVFHKALEDEAWEVRAQAAVGAGRIKLESAITKLMFLLNDDEWWVRFRAAEALKKIGDKGVQVLSDAAEGTSRAAEIAELVLTQEAA